MERILKRHEVKYMITQEQYEEIKDVLSEKLADDPFGDYLVQSIYFDTDNWDVIRTSIDKPIFKEKLRLRCYGMPNGDSKIFLELKKKFKGIVYKRGISFPANELSEKKLSDIVSNNSSQIGRELAHYMGINPVFEKAYISYKRFAFEESGFRVTFDRNTHFRTQNLNFENPEAGLDIFPADRVLMEVKAVKGIPLWFTHILSERQIYPISFSKYGMSYTKYILGVEGNTAWKTLPVA